MTLPQRELQEQRPWPPGDDGEETNDQRKPAGPMRPVVTLTDPDEVMEAGIPRQPRNFAELGLSKAFLVDLTLKILYFASNPTASQLVQRLGLSSNLAQQLLTSLTEERLCEVIGRSDLYTGNYRYRLGDRGHERVKEALERSRYAGPAPVPLDQYVEVIQRQAQMPATLPRGHIKEAMKDLILEPEVADAIARALFSGRAAIFYGPSGNGKSHMLRQFAAVIGGEVLMPYSIYAYGQVIRLFEPSLHHVAEEEGDKKRNMDGRWVRIQRPALTLSTELGLQALELAYDPQSRFYQAPPHLKAQGGVLVIDDLGRQRVSPRDLLARWLIALERGWDTLNLITGEQLCLPLQVQLLFATSTPLPELAEEPFLRRIPYKVEIPNPKPEGFAEILKRLCHRRQVLLPPGAVEHAIEVLYGGPGIEPQAAYANELVRIVVENARFDGREPVLTPEAFDQAFHLFMAERARQPARPSP